MPRERPGCCRTVGSACLAGAGNVPSPRSGCVVLGQPEAACSVTVAQTVDSVDVEPMQPLTHGLRMTPDLGRHGLGRLPSRLATTILARRIQSPGACRAPVSFRTIRS